MNKRKAVFKWYLMTVPDLVSFVRKVVTRMTGNATYATPTPTLASVTTAVDALDTAHQAAADGGIELTAIANTNKVVVVDLTRQLCDYVNLIADGDEVKILSSGFDLNKERTPTGKLPAPGGLEQVVRMGQKGLTVRWNRVAGSRAYLVQIVAYTPGQPYPTEDQFRDVGTVTRRSIEITGLRAGTTHLVRVAAIGPDGKSDFSNPLETVVL